MSETSEQRTKRQITNAMEKYKPVYQATVVLEDLINDIELDIETLVMQLPKLKDRVSRAFTDGAVLFWLKGKYLSPMRRTYPMVCIYFQVKPDIPKLRLEVADVLHPAAVKFYFKNFDDESRLSWIKTIKSQKLHDLEKSFGKGMKRRFAIRNKSCIIG